jgi:flagellin-like protein
VKGVSPIIVAVLLIAFTLSIALLAGPFFNDTVKTSQEGVSTQQEDVLEAGSADLKIESASYDKNGDNLSVIVRNTGTTELSGFTVTVFGDGPVQDRYNRSLEEEEIGEFGLVLESFENRTRIRVSSQQYPVSADLDAGEVAAGFPPSKPTDVSIS